MGSFCSKGSAVDKSPSDVTISVGSRRDLEKLSSPSELKAYGLKSLKAGDAVGKRSLEQSFSFSEGMLSNFGNTGISTPRQPALTRVLSEKSTSAKSKAAAGAKSGTHKVAEVSSLLGRAGTVGFGMAVEVLDTLGSSMTNLNIGSGFSSGLATKGNKISILAFEVANTIVKGANLMHSLSEESIKHLKEVVLPSEAVQRIVSTDRNELLRIAAADKREELKVFSGEVVRFGNRCKDPQWHNLDRYFAKLGSEITPRQQLKEQAAGVMQQLLTLVQYTAELYHELHAFDRFDQDYRRKLQEEENPGEGFQILRHELKSQGKHVKSLKKKSLWSRNLEEVMEKLVDIVHFMHFEIHEAFGSAEGDNSVVRSFNSHQRLGPAGLALHYANIINQIDTLVSRSGSVPPNTRDSLYQNLPPTIKSALRSKLQVFQLNEELTVPQIKAEMEKTLQWLVPIANNTTKAHHGFGWVGEWASTGAEVAHKPAGHSTMLRVETFFHADKANTDAYILDLIVWLHHFINLSRRGKNFFSSRSPVKSTLLSSSQNSASSALSSKSSPINSSTYTSTLTEEEQEMLRQIVLPKRSYRISKSQDFDMERPQLFKLSRLSKSSSNTPTRMSKNESRKMSLPVIDFDINRTKALDVIDRVDSLRKL
ncbi:uncharacterized protein LOC110095231 isoform X1 [Dendrobium catenatum]|uniref:uncharacterized protein LOC110095231 isoform X1 n=1 Tax=Dendrobium catenatum TaxID=906689 RepID=UPI0009F45EC7|nr:uncharacterized protein LOC110095231 isoform X1 [Dendrobium catenatum]